MDQRQIIECVPNFSEGRDPEVIRQIAACIEAVEGVNLLDVDPGKATNRTVVTFVGEPQHVIEAAFEAIKKAAELIDMRSHQGEHPRMGATDVCPLVPVANITMEETVQWAHKLAERVGEHIGIPVYMYEAAATKPEWQNLAVIRAGEYEKLAQKLNSPEWAPDYGPAKFNATVGATVIGARDFLIAYNVNLNTTSARRANAVAFDIREKGRIKREGDPVTGNIVRDSAGKPIRTRGKCKGVKAIGWYIEEYGIAQISMNITSIRDTALHEAFEACCESARTRGLRVTGSELVGLVPLQVMLDAGKHFLKKQQRSSGIPDREIIHIAAKSLGLDELSAFDPDKKIIEYCIRDDKIKALAELSLEDFLNSTASEGPTPGGGSVSAYLGALGASLGTMVANLSAHKRGWDTRWEEFSTWAEQGKVLQIKLLKYVDQDTQAFNAIIDAIRMPKSTAAEKEIRAKQITAATKRAIEVPFEVMKTSCLVFDICKTMLEQGNPASSSDAAVGALCARAAVQGAWLNVRINLGDLNDAEFKDRILKEGAQLAEKADLREKEILEIASGKMSN